jgi:large subunit ribosomal protein L25
MRKDITLAAVPRASRGKNEARRQRVRHTIPAVVYGTGKEAIPVTVSPKEVNRILHSASGANTIFDVGIEGVETAPVMIADWQHHPVKGNLLHVDLKRIDMSARLRVKVPVHPKGDPRGVKQQGGLHEIVTREIEIECLPDEIPESFELNAVDLLIGQALRASQVRLTGSMVLISPPDQVISHVIATRATAEAETPEAAAAAAPATPEPELIKKGKKEEAAEEKKKK